jgi:O-antigen/teichoic acid export membrane protein
VLRIDTPLMLLLIGFILAPEALGLFSAAQYWAAIPAGKALVIINQITLPVFAKLRDNASETVTIIKGFFVAFAVIATPVFWGLAAVAPEFVSSVLGAQWVSAAPLLALMCVAMPIRLVRDFSLSPLQARGLDMEVRKLHLVHTLSQIIFTVIGAFIGGAIGASIGMLIAGVLDGIVAHTRMCSLLNVDPAPIRKKFLLCAGGAALMYAAVRTSSVYIEPMIKATVSPILQSPLLLVLIILVGIFAYSVFAALALSRDVKPIIQSFKSRNSAR